jgi:hypothetical protein
MPKLIIQIDMNNAAFDDEPMDETSRILRAFCKRITEMEAIEPGDYVSLYDIDGNRVGFAQCVEN